MTVGIAAIFKNESPYIIEWIAFHRAVNVSRFFIADNDSTDGSKQLLRALDAAGIINYVDFPFVGNTTQLAAYSLLQKDYGRNVEWLAFIDADEFMMPQGNCKTITELTSSFGRHVGAVCLNWAIYGSNGHETATPELVLERFQSRAEDQFDANRHYKSIVRTSAFMSTGENPHYFKLKPGHLAVHSNGSLVAHANLRGLSRRVIWDNFRLNHYVVKSYQEYVERKQARGRLGSETEPLDENFFRAHDRNETLDVVDGNLLLKTQQEILAIEKLL